MTLPEEQSPADPLPGDSLVINYPDESSNPKDMLLWAGVLMLLSLVAYWPATQGKFIWRDDVNVARNPLFVRPGGLGNIWTQWWWDRKDYPLPEYRPFADSLAWMEFQIYGHDSNQAVDPFGFHVLNLVLAAGAAVLLWLILHRLQLPGAWVAAAIFAVHPLNTESAAWISQLGTVLAGALFFGGIYMFLLFTEKWKTREGNPEPQWELLAGSVVCLVLALLSNLSTLGMPVVLMLILWWKEKLNKKFAGLLVAMLVVGVVIAIGMAGSPGADELHLNLAQRLILAGRGICFYTGKALVPIQLSVLYPKWELNGTEPLQYLPLAAAILIVIGCFALRKKLGRGVAAGIGAFVLCLLPALGLFDRPSMRLSFVADHEAYLATAAMCALVISAGARALRRARLQHSHGQAAIGISLILIVALGGASWVRSAVFNDDLSLWQDAVAKNPREWFAHLRLATALNSLAQSARDNSDADTYTKNLNQALDEATKAQELNPDDAETQLMLGRIYIQQRDAKDGIDHLARATQLDPNLLEAWEGLASALIAEDRNQDAIAKLDEALRIDPHSSAVHRLLGEVYAGLGQNDRAISEQKLALQYKEDNTYAREDYADVLAKVGRIKEAKYQYTILLQINKDQPRVWYKVGIIATQENDLPSAITFFKTALIYQPDFAEAQRDLQLAEKMQKDRAATQPSTQK